MNKTNIRKLIYRIRYRYATRQNVVIVIAFIVAASWAWGSINMMQRNYRLQQDVDAKIRQEQLIELQVQNAQLAQRYYQSDEYKELETRRLMGRAYAGEKVLILPPNSEKAKAEDTVVSTARQPIELTSNFQQWTNFLLGGNRERLQSDE